MVAQAGGRPQEAEQQTQGGGLSRSVGTEKTEHLAGGDFQMEVVEGAEAAVVFRQVVGAQKHGWPWGRDRVGDAFHL